MGRLDFEWDPRKATLNRRKHGVSFEEAATAFADEQALVLEDPDHSDREDRFVLLGLSAALRILGGGALLSRGRDGDPSDIGASSGPDGATPVQ